MAKRTEFDPADFIVPLHMNGLAGRMLKMPARYKTKQREILLVYGHHASIERMFGLAEDFTKYGNVTLPDLPGFGGMQSFYKIGRQPTLDNLADYLAAFVKLRYKRKRITIAAMSFGFAVVTRMLQLHPEIAKKVDILISLAGFASGEDFAFSKFNLFLLRGVARFSSRKYTALLVRHLVLRKFIIKSAYRMVGNSHSKLKDADKAEREKRIEFEVGLWQSNDVRTYMHTMLTMFDLDIFDKTVPLKVHHVSVKGDRYFDNDLVEQHLAVIFEQVEVIESSLPAHAPTVVADAKAAAPFVPTRLRRLLAKSN